MENCVGVDVSKHQLDWVLGGEGNVARVPNTPAGVRRLVTTDSDIGVRREAFETYVRWSRTSSSASSRTPDR